MNDRAPRLDRDAARGRSHGHPFAHRDRTFCREAVTTSARESRKSLRDNDVTLDRALPRQGVQRSSPFSRAPAIHA